MINREESGDSGRKVKLIVLGVVVLLAAGVWGWSLFGGGGAPVADPAGQAKAEALKQGYERTGAGRPPEAQDAPLPGPPTRAAQKAGPG